MNMFNFSIARSPRQWLISLTVCSVLLHCLFSTSLWHVEGSLAELIEDAAFKIDQPHVVNREYTIDIDKLREIDNNSKRIEDGEILEDIDEGFASDDGDESDESDHHDSNQPKSILGRLKHAAQATIAPAQSYYNLVKRYRNWRVEYTKLQKEYGTKENGEPKLQNLMDVLRLEYAKVDKILTEDACRLDDADAPDETQKEIENIDLIFNILKMLIDRLEANLIKLKEHGPPKDDEPDDDAETRSRLEEIEHHSKEAIDRAKRIVAQSAKDAVKNELRAIICMFVFDTAASYMLNQAERGPDGTIGLLGKLEPFVILIANVNTPFVVSYLRDVKFRAILNVTNSIGRASWRALKCSKQ